MSRTYSPGSFFVTEITGAVGLGIRAGQFLCGEPSRYAHAGIITSIFGDTVEAQPGGARPGHVEDYADRPTLVCDGPIRLAMQTQAASLRRLRAEHPLLARAGAPRPEGVLRATVVAQAKGLIDTPYSALDYVALGLLHWHLPSEWVRARVERSGHMICSQLVDAVYRRSGITLFTDHRLPGDVMPADLANWADDYASSQAVAA